MKDHAIPWVERYRPRSLHEISHQVEVVATLQTAVRTGQLPHLLLYGPPGSGKTSVALALCRQLWHPSQWRRRVLELNASDERGISVVRDKIKHFASLAVGGSSTSAAAVDAASTMTGTGSFFKKKQQQQELHSINKDAMDVEETAYPNPPFKVIILDEADTVTPDAQAALRRIIEAHSRVTRFVLICNYVTRIIEPLASRCAKFRFQALPPASMKERLQNICAIEECHVPVDVLDQILDVAEGDMRRAVTTLQSIHALNQGGECTPCGPSSKNSENANDPTPLSGPRILDVNAISELVGRTPPAIVDSLWGACASDVFDVMQAAVEEFTASGFSAQLLLSAFLSKLIHDPVLNESCKAMIAIRMAEAEKKMSDGADEYLQLMAVCCSVQTRFIACKRSSLN